MSDERYYATRSTSKYYTVIVRVDLGNANAIGCVVTAVKVLKTWSTPPLCQTGFTGH